MKRGEIWLVGLDPTAGHEQRGRRPVLIVSPDSFQPVDKSCGGSSDYEWRQFCPYRRIHALVGGATETSGVVRCDQPRSLDLTARGAIKLETVSSGIMDEVLAKLNTILQ